MNEAGLSTGNDLCDHHLLGECQLYSRQCEKDCNLFKPDTIERLAHVITCQEQMINLYKDIVEDLMTLALQHISADAEELRGITAKINEAATVRAEI